MYTFLQDQGARSKDQGARIEDRGSRIQWSVVRGQVQGTGGNENEEEFPEFSGSWSL